MLDGNNNTSRFLPGPEGLKNHVPFAIGTDVKEILAATEATGRELTRQIKTDLESGSSFQRAVLFRDFPAVGQVDDDTIGKFQGTWTFYLLKTMADRSQLAAALGDLSKRNPDLVKTHQLQNPEISKELLRLLRSSR